MKKLTDEEMISVKGGANFATIGTVFSVIVSFISGIISGYFNPVKCNN